LNAADHLQRQGQDSRASFAAAAYSPAMKQLSGSIVVSHVKARRLEAGS
jgi:hypothetical protein